MEVRLGGTPAPAPAAARIERDVREGIESLKGAGPRQIVLRTPWIHARHERCGVISIRPARIRPPGAAGPHAVRAASVLRSSAATSRSDRARRKCKIESSVGTAVHGPERASLSSDPTVGPVIGCWPTHGRPPPQWEDINRYPVAVNVSIDIAHTRQLVS